MDEKAKQKNVKLLALADDASDEESMSAQCSRRRGLQLQTRAKIRAVINTIIYQGRPQKSLYRLASIIAENFRVRTYYASGSPIKLRFVGIESDVQIAQITLEYARGSASYCARQFLKLPEVKRKWQLKQDYIEGYSIGLSKTFRNQVRTNGYEITLQVPEIVQEEFE